ncbi:DUF4340 domain-containing protein [Pseudohalioglobus sediminis]|uniref:DUF4340 domain-containing protein n=1 Tax=Pseudohalioglobus sediminis TaxID=2606449 RepID=A0A5B0WRS0_9GAMM|nr:DUF4340 domain-containing protein [Pseudohalioglobus sediminis]KAA1189653.1 DUF4340 domain-containing protein [Pseudohalioglobus sediminis]
MSRFLFAMVMLLLVQLLVLANSYRQDADALTKASGQALIDTSGYLVEEVLLEDHRGDKVRLRRAGKGWLLPELDGLPADAERVDLMLEKLTVTDPGWPVAQTLAARQRFQVARYHFRRKLVLSSQQQELGEVYLGTAPVFRKVHARNAAQDDIYSVELSLFELPADAGKWLEPRLLQVRAPVAITADGYSLTRTGEKWVLGSGAEPDPRELNALLNALRGLRVQGVAEESVAARLPEVEAELILQVQALAGDVKLALFELEGEYYIRSSEYPHLFVISAYEFDKLTGIDGILMSAPQPPE